MATKSKLPRTAKSALAAPISDVKTAPPQDLTASSTQAATPGPAQPVAQGAPSLIRKGVYLSALVYIEADFAPADDFVTPATSALKSALSTASKENSGGFSISLKKVEVQNDVEDAATEKDSGETKFQF